MATVEDKYLAPVEQPVFLLDSKESWNKLTEKEKLYAHYLSEGASSSFALLLQGHLRSLSNEIALDILSQNYILRSTIVGYNFAIECPMQSDMECDLLS
jgi:hypothetical protein